MFAPGSSQIPFKHLLGLPVSQVSYQAYSNVAWSLAVMDVFNIDALLAQLTAKHSQLLGERGINLTSAQPKREDIQQLQSG